MLLLGGTEGRDPDKQEIAASIGILLTHRRLLFLAQGFVHGVASVIDHIYFLLRNMVKTMDILFGKLGNSGNADRLSGIARKEACVEVLVF